MRIFIDSFRPNCFFFPSPRDGIVIISISTSNQTRNTAYKLLLCYLLLYINFLFFFINSPCLVPSHPPCGRWPLFTFSPTLYRTYSSVDIWATSSRRLMSCSIGYPLPTLLYRFVRRRVNPFYYHRYYFNVCTWPHTENNISTYYYYYYVPVMAIVKNSCVTRRRLWRSIPRTTDIIT